MFHRIKRRLANYKSYVLVSEVRHSFKRCVLELDRRTLDRACVSLTTGKPSQGSVLVSYILDPFLSPDRPIPTSHTQYWESLQIARTFLDLGYDVDVISYRNLSFLPDKTYDIILDARHNLERLARLLPSRCRKLFHIDVAHTLFGNAAEMNRLLALQHRRGVTLTPRRYEQPNLGIEHADCATIIGNEFTMGTFRYAGKPLYPLPIPSAVTCSWPDGKDWEACRRRFLWLSSGGLVRKGLDLALEAFAGMPGYELFVCAPVDQEEDFRRAYAKELYATPNIRTIGWVDVAGPQFLEIARSCAGILLASCAEGTAGSVITGMHAGLIPIVTYESGVDVHDFGILLKTCDVEDLQEAIRTAAALPAPQLKEKARRAWEYARAFHTREKYAEEFRTAIRAILAAPYGNGHRL